MDVPRREGWWRDPRPGVLVLCGGAFAVGIVALVLAIRLAPAFVAFDTAVSAAVRRVDSPFLNAFAVTFSVIGDVPVMATLTVFVTAALLVGRRRAEALLVSGTMLAGFACSELLKAVVHRARPVAEVARIAVPPSMSFPSGHAVAAAIFFGLLSFIVVAIEQRSPLAVRALFTGVCALLVGAISLSRVYLGVHYVSDIVGGWLLAAAIMVVAIGAYVVLTSGRQQD